MQRVSFFDLARPVQERFVETARARAAPSPLAFRAAFPKRVAIWSALSLSFLLVAAVVTSLGFGDLDSSLAIAPSWKLFVLVVLFSLVAVCAVEALAMRWGRRALPYRPGVYLFPSGIIDASIPQFSVYRMSELDVTPAGSRSIALRHASGASFSFPTPDAERARAQIGEYKRALARAEASNDPRELAALDPLKDTGFASPFSPPTSIPRPRPPWFRIALPLAAVAGIPLGWAAWQARNAASERALYAAAVSANDVASYEAYLARGGTRSEVSEVLLPRAELDRARKAGGVQAIEDFLARRPGSKVEGEAMAALKAALLAELEEAKRTGSLKALRAIPEQHPRHQLIAAELAVAVRDAYQQAFEKYKKLAPAADERTLSFVKRLLEYAEKKGPLVQIRFVERTPQSHDLADIAVKNSMYFAGTKSLPSQYFDEAHTKAREVIAGKELIAELGKAFSPEILKFEIGERLHEPKPEQLEVNVPTLFIEHTTRLSGTYVSSAPRGVYMGVSVMFESSFRIPRDPDFWSVKHSAWNPPQTELLKRDPSPKLLYDTAALDGYRGFSQKLTSRFFAKG